MTKMTKTEIKTKWLEELRSGKHNQVKGTLCGTTEDGEVGYCCLGVLHKIVLGRKVEQEEYGTVSTGAYSHYKGLSKIIPSDIEHQGIEMNDSGEPFEAIADMIEKKWVTE